jgi:lipid A ethanolaminephosphotransferase
MLQTFKNLMLKPLALLNNLKTQTQAIVLVAVFIMLTGNWAMFSRILEVYPPLQHHDIPFLISLAIFFSCLTTLFLLAVCHGRLTRWLLAFFLVGAASAAYYMDAFGVIVDVVMLENIVQTNPQELAGLMTPIFALRLILLGVLPAWLALKYTPKARTIATELKSRLVTIGALVLLLVFVLLPFTAGYTSFIREHRVTRFYANPTYFTYSLIKQVTGLLKPVTSAIVTKTAQDAVEIGQTKHHELIIMVVGETARADRFSLNGYKKETNPLLAKENIISFSNVSSCGTSTGVSVPCMFSVLDREHYDKDQALHTENALEVLFENHVQILWRDNNSDSKGVATRLKYENFKTPTLNPVCDKECRDIGMLSGLDKYVAARKGKDILIVLHQMGNHGPEYYRRYPPEFAKFKPMCMTGELKDCSQEEINNSYDNAILYTDYFLSEVIQFLKKYDGTHETAMLYVADHGESLGENGWYLHAAPYAVAPKEQTHVPAILWMGKHFDFSLEQAKPYKDFALSHDDVFCSLLVAFELETKTCASKHQMLMQNNDIKAGNHQDH